MGIENDLNMIASLHSGSERQCFSTNIDCMWYKKIVLVLQDKISLGNLRKQFTIKN